jgi:hypothetical protein
MSSMAGKISMGARREVVSAVTERYRTAKRAEKGRILDALCATTGWHRKHAVRALRQHEPARPSGVEAPRERGRKYGVTIKDALTALWEASDRVCGKRLKVMIPILLPALEQHGRLRLGQADRDRVLAISAATIDRLLVDVKIAVSGGRRRRAGFYSAIRREVPIRTFNDWNSPLPGFCEVDMVAHGGTSVAGSFIQTLTMVDVATGWTECLPLLTREGSLVVEAIRRAACNAPARAPRQRPQPVLPRRSARRRRPASRVPRTGEPVGPIKPGFACHPSSTHILPRSRPGSLRNRS